MTGMSDRIRALIPRINAMRERGLSDGEIGRRLGYAGGQQRVAQIAGPRGNKPPPRTEVFVAEARRLWATGLSIRQIGKELGVTLNVVVGVAHRNNFPPRPSPIKR